MPPDEPVDEDRLEELPEDNQPPFSPADPPRDQNLDADDDEQPVKDIDDTHPATDSNIEREEVYEEGKGSAAGLQEPNSANTVVGYEKPQSPEGSGSLS